MLSTHRHKCFGQWARHCLTQTATPRHHTLDGAHTATQAQPTPSVPQTHNLWTLTWWCPNATLRCGNHAPTEPQASHTRGMISDTSRHAALRGAPTAAPCHPAHGETHTEAHHAHGDSSTRTQRTTRSTCGRTVTYNTPQDTVPSRCVIRELCERTRAETPIVQQHTRKPRQRSPEEGVLVPLGASQGKQPRMEPRGRGQGSEYVDPEAQMQCVWKKTCTMASD